MAPLATKPRRALILTISWIITTPFNSAHGQTLNNNDLSRLLEQGSCQRCKLQDSDLVHADLRNAKLQGAHLQGSNLSQAILDGADLSGSNLSHANLFGASLRGANLRGSILTGTDLRQSDLTGAEIDAGGLKRSHWQDAKGVSEILLSHPELHNAGVASSRLGQTDAAERWFSLALRNNPNAAISWVARGLNRLELGQIEAAASDLNYAKLLYSEMGDMKEAKILDGAVKKLIEPPREAKKGNGLGSNLISGAIAALKTLAPLAIKAMAPTPF